MTTVRIPNLVLRPYQLPAWRALEAGARRAALVWPRRAGKDTLSLAWMAREGCRQVGNYWHLMPEAVQSRKAMWNGINREGKRIIDVAFPPAIRSKTLDNEMLIKLKSGSTIQFGGSDRYDALVGSNPRGVVFSEFAIADPRAYNFVRPILAENDGWAVFPYTPRGRNHGFELFERLQDDPDSYAQILTCEDTGHMSDTALALERKELSEELYLQEYFCSWDFGLEGALLAKQMNRAMTEGRICHVPINGALPVWVAFDLGLSDSTAMWFFQVEPGGRVLFVDYYEANGEQLEHYAGVLRAKGYNYGKELILPHDAGTKRLGMESLQNQLRHMGWPNRVLKVEHSILPGIEATRVLINRAWFDKDKTELGRAALSGYRREYDEKRQVFKPTPLHDWASHGADAMRYAARAIDAGFTNTSYDAPIDYSNMNRAAI